MAEVKKLTITIPSDLAERLEPWRDRMNISKLCSEAIEREIAVVADLPREVQEFTDVITRLRTERAEARKRDYWIGYEDGFTYAKGASEQDLVFYASIWESCKHLMRGKTLRTEDVELPRSEEVHLHEFMGDRKVIDAGVYKVGWLDGLQTVWDVVEHKV